MNTSDFDYNLPKEFIAQRSVEPRDHSKLMVVSRTDCTRQIKQFFDIGEFLRPGDLLVRNVTKAFKARLFGTTSTGVEVEVFLLNPLDDSGLWKALGRPGRKIAIGDVVTFSENFSGEVIAKEDGALHIKFDGSADEVMASANTVGHIPIPPYVDEEPDDITKYQTVYAKTEGSVAAPTAGFHFTDELIAQLKESGVGFADVTLHVGLGTFAPMKTETLDEHTMHAEYVELTQETIDRIAQTKANGGRVIAVGTTTVRTLEGVAKLFDGQLQEHAGDVNLFIQPGFEFKVIDGLITNFHLPKSTLLVLVSALAGRECILQAYEEAKQNDFRFYSFGDAMLLI